MSKTERRALYLQIVEQTGSLVQARKRLGLTSRTIGEWRRDPDFVEQVQDALDVSQDAIRAKVREMALAGSEPMLALSMKVIEPALRPQSSIAVGIQVGSAERRVSQMTDAELLDRARQITRDAELRALGLPQPTGDVIDVEALPAPSIAREAHHGAVDDANDIDPDSVL